MGYFTSLYASELPHRAVAVHMYLKDRADKCYPATGTNLTHCLSSTFAYTRNNQIKKIKLHPTISPFLPSILIERE
jgi:hypothetical protein